MNVVPNLFRYSSSDNVRTDCIILLDDVAIGQMRSSRETVDGKKTLTG